MALGIMSAISGLVNPIANVIQKRNDNKTAIETIKAKAAAGAVAADASVTLSKAEWQLTALKLSQGSWKDEYLCILFTIPIFAPLLSFLPGVDQVAANVQNLLGEDYRTIILVIVGASFGVRLWKG